MTKLTLPSECDAVMDRWQAMEEIRAILMQSILAAGFHAEATALGAFGPIGPRTLSAWGAALRPIGRAVDAAWAACGAVEAPAVPDERWEYFDRTRAARDRAGHDWPTSWRIRNGVAAEPLTVTYARAAGAPIREACNARIERACVSDITARGTVLLSDDHAARLGTVTYMREIAVRAQQVAAARAAHEAAP